MRKIIVMAEEGELSLLDKAKEQLGLDLRDAQLIYTGVGAINIIRSLAGLDRDAEVYNIGYVGSANFEIGTWVEVTEVRLNHPNVTYPEPELQLSPITNHQSPITNHLCVIVSLPSELMMFSRRKVSWAIPLVGTAVPDPKSYCSPHSGQTAYIPSISQGTRLLMLAQWGQAMSYAS